MKKNIILIISIALLLFIILQGCQNEDNTNSNAAVNQEGLDLMVTNCYSCHQPKGEIDKRIAPPMIAVKKHYLEDGMTEVQFVDAIVDFLEQPSEKTSKMPGAVKKFGVMPNMSFPKEQVQKIAEYIYNQKIESPKWFEEHYNEKHKKGLSQKPPYEVGNYQEMGMHFALTTKSQLGKNLMNAIKTKGTIHALQFCNTQASPLTDSMSRLHQVAIKRVSDRPRNPDNAANETELKHISTFKKQLAAGEATKPIVEEKGDMVYFYSPIKTNDMCMQCHGTPNEAVMNEILSLYPTDKATGYSPNEIRGIWSIQMRKVKDE